MARVGSTPTKDVEKADGEPVVNFMAEAPPARPYVEAISDEQRGLLRAANLPVPE